MVRPSSNSVMWILIAVIILSCNCVHRYQQHNMKVDTIYCSNGGSIIPTAYALTTTTSTSLSLSSRLPMKRGSLIGTKRSSISSSNSLLFSTSSTTQPSQVYEESSLNSSSESSSSTTLEVKATTGRRSSKRRILRNIVTLRPIRHYITHKLMYPNTSPDTSYNDIPLPTGSFGCPFRGSNTKLSHKSYGRNYFFNLHSKKHNHPNIFKCFERTTKAPSVVLVGSKLIKSILRNEFDMLESNAVPFTRKIVGPNSLRMIQNKVDHATIRQLVGTSVNNKESITDAIPMINKSAISVIQEQILNPLKMRDNDSLNSNVVNVTMIDICQEYTLQVAWRQILGLNLSDKEIPTFHQAVQDWMDGLFRPDAGMKARQYLVDLISKRIEELEALGPNHPTASSSTLGRMIFATIDNEDESEDEFMKDGAAARSTSKPIKEAFSRRRRRLTRDEIIDNSLLLILGGTDTSAGTLTATMAMLGLQQCPNISPLLSSDVDDEGEDSSLELTPWEKIVQEQQQLIQKYGQKDDHDFTYTRQMLSEEECPYLDSVIKEALRISPVPGGSSRATKETMIVKAKKNNNHDDTTTPNKKKSGGSGYKGVVQIPKGWAVCYSIWLSHRSDPNTIQDNDLHMDWFYGFIPERWMDSESNKKKPTEYIPFGAGPRYCLGADLAMIEMKIFLATLAKSNIEFDLINYGPTRNYAKIKGRRRRRHNSDNVKDGMDMYTKSLIPYPADGVQVKVRSSTSKKQGRATET